MPRRKTHGGRRKGAGRPVSDEPIRSVYLGPVRCTEVERSAVMGALEHAALTLTEAIRGLSTVEGACYLESVRDARSNATD